MPQAARNVLFVTGLAVVVGALAYLLAARSNEPRDALAMAPSRTVGVLELDVPGVRGSALWADLVGEGDTGMARIRERCGIDPLDALRTVHVFLLGGGDGATDPADERLEEMAVVARGAIDHEALARCIGDVVAEDGGGVHPTTIEGVDALASDRGSSVVAFYGRDGLVAGADVVVAELLRIRQGASPPMPRDEGLARLWRRTASRRHLRAVARLPRNWRRLIERVASFGELDAMAGARALGIGATLGEGIALTVAVELDTADTAHDAQRALEARIASTLRDPEVGLSALAVSLRRVTLEANDRDLVARIELDRAELETTVALIRRRIASREQAPPAGLPAPRDDERLAPSTVP